jgi:hypothetical protein
MVILLVAVDDVVNLRACHQGRPSVTNNPEILVRNDDSYGLVHVIILILIFKLPTMASATICSYCACPAKFGGNCNFSHFQLPTLASLTLGT